MLFRSNEYKNPNRITPEIAIAELRAISSPSDLFLFFLGKILVWQKVTIIKMVIHEYSII